MQIPRKARNVLFIFPLIFLLNIHFALIPTKANTGDLDVTFAGDGQVTKTGTLGGYFEYIASSYVTDDNEIFGAGAVWDSSYDNFMGLWKYNEDGTPDTSFDSDGFQSFYGGYGNQDRGVGTVVDSSGNVYLLGETFDEYVFRYRFALVRYTSSGALDTSYATAGDDGVYFSTEVYASNGYDLRPYGIVIDENDKVYVLARYGGAMSIWKFNTNGTLDTSFDTDGIVTHLGLGNYNSYGYDIAIDSQDRLLVAGKSRNDSTMRAEPTIWRINSSDGSMDTTFDSDGVVGFYITNAGEGFNGLAVNSEDEVAAVSYLDNPNPSNPGSNLGQDSLVVKFEEDGDLDTTFDSDGYALQGYSTSDFIWTTSYAAEFDSQDRLLVNGRGASVGGSDPHVQVLRYLPNGSLDSEFSDDGKAFIQGGGAYSLDSLELDSKERAVIVGSQAYSGVTHLSIWRLRAGDLDTVGVDVNPGLCENYVDVDSAGVLTVAIQGTATFDVTDIVTSSIELEGAEPEQTFVQDMSDATDCDEPSDTYDDLIIRFRISDLPASLQSFTTGQTTDLDLSADVGDNGSIGGTSTIEIINN